MWPSVLGQGVPVDRDPRPAGSVRRPERCYSITRLPLPAPASPGTSSSALQPSSAPSIRTETMAELHIFRAVLAVERGEASLEQILR